MYCRDPYVKGSQAYPCGRCDPCLYNRKRLWTHRIMLEATCYTDNCFLTLTYADKHLPTLDDGTPTLKPEDLRNFWKRLRKEISPLKIRYYAVGEYGDDNFRPHYHAALFNFPPCRQKETQYRDGLISCCPRCDLVNRIWGKGRVFLGTLETDSAQYISGYVLKKLYKKTDPRLDGRHPEFSRMSTDGGIGVSFMDEVASVLMQYEVQGDVPSSLAHGKRMMPLGRYLRRKLREKMGLDPAAPPQPLDEKMQALFDAAITATQAFPSARSTVYKNLLIDADNQSVLNMQARQQIFKPKRRL